MAGMGDTGLMWLERLDPVICKVSLQLNFIQK